MFPSSWSSLSRFFYILEIASGMIDRSGIGRFRVVIVGLGSSMIGYSTNDSYGTYIVIDISMIGTRTNWSIHVTQKM
jgi:hypothetical protein